MPTLAPPSPLVTAPVRTLPPPTGPAVQFGAPPSPSAAQPRRLLSVLLVVAVALAFADASVVALALPDLYADFNTTIVGVSWVLTTYALVVAVVAVPVTLLRRRLRPMALVVAGLVTFVAASLAAALAPGLAFLLVARATQGVGATLLLAGSLPVLAATLGSATRARAWWATAAAVGGVAGPALGGILTQLFDWRAIFLVQAPIAALALAVVAAPAARASRADRSARRAGLGQTIVANVGFVLVFGALVGALFLGVLLAIEVWRYSPIEGALLVSALPVGMFAARPLVSAPIVARAVGGALLLAGGLVGLAFVPGASPWAAAVAFAFCGFGFALVTGVLGPASMPEDGALVRDSTASIGFRHLGLVLGLVLIAPVLSSSMAAGTQRATLGATRSLLEAEVPLTDKIPVTWALRNAIDDAPKGQVPDLTAVFDKHGAGSNPELAAARDGLMGTITDAITRSFRPAFGVAAALAALAALPAGAVALRSRRRAEQRERRRPVALAVVSALGLGVVALVAGEHAAGASAVGNFQAVDACTASPETYPGDGVDGVAQRIALSALNGAACELHTTRERLVLSLDPHSGYRDVTWDKSTLKKALDSGIRRAILDAEDRGSLPGWAGSILSFATDHAPIGWIADRIPLPG